MTRLELVFAFEECEYNIKKIELDSYVPLRQVYCEAGGIEKVGDGISVFFQKMKNNMKTMRDKAEIRKKYYLKRKQAQQNQKRNLDRLDDRNDTPKFYPDIAKYVKVANSGMVKMIDGLRRFKSTNYESISDLKQAFLDFRGMINLIDRELTEAMTPTRMMLEKDYAKLIMDMKKNGIDIMEVGLKFDELLDTLKKDSENILDNKALDIGFREKYSRTARDVASELSKTQLTMVKNISTLIEFPGVKK